MPISVVFDPPLPSDSPSTFNTKAFTLLGDLNDWSTQANALPGEVATNLTTLLASPPAIGSTTPAAGNFTTVSASSYTASSGYYINASAVLTPGATTQGTQFVTSSVLQWACGSGGYSWNNNANSASLMSMTNAGAVTIPGSVTVGTLSASNGLTITKNGPTARALTIKNDSLNINEYVEIHFQNSGTDVIQSSIRSVRDTSGSFGTSLQFLTENDFTSGEAVRMTLSGTGAVTIPGSLSLTGGTFGYGVGAGGTVIQATSKSTAVTLNKPCGQITMHNAALADGASVTFSVTNSFLTSNTDGILCSVAGGVSNLFNYTVLSASAGGGLFYINVKNETAGSLSEAVVIQFEIIRGATS